MLTITDKDERFQEIRHIIIVTLIILRKYKTAIAFALGIDSRDMTHEIEADAAFEATHVPDWTAHAPQADHDSETDVHDEAIAIRDQARPYYVRHA